MVVGLLLIAFFVQIYLTTGLHSKFDQLIANSATRETANNSDSHASVVDKKQPNKSDEKNQADAHANSSPLSPFSFDKWLNEPFDSKNWNPFDEIDNMQNRMNQLFGHTQSRFHHSQLFGDSETNRQFYPRMDLLEKNDRFVVHVDLPGTEKSKIDIKLEARQLDICFGKRKLSSLFEHRREPVKKFKALDLVLIIDDDKLFCDAVKRHLKSKNIRVVAANTGSAGMEILKREKVGVVLLDQRLPDVEGHTLCTQIIKHNDQIQIIFITAHPSFEGAIQAIRAGAHDYLSKPFEMEELELATQRAYKMLDYEKLTRIDEYQRSKDTDKTILVGEKGLAEVRKMVDLAANEEQESLTILAGGVAHDFNTFSLVF